MDQTNPPPSFRPAHRRRAVVVVAALFLAGIAWAVWTAPWRAGSRGPSSTLTSTHRRDPSADSPYRNTRPGVAYVGDAVCARCHGEIAEAYRSHPMGRSMAPVAEGDGGPPLTAAARIPFDFQGVHYSIERRDGRLFHKASRQDADGRTYAEVEAEIRYALGSGTRGITYLIERDGFLFQSPIAWFAQQKRWDISPGYGANPRPNFERAIQRGCLFCHTNNVHSVPGTLNRYESPIFASYAIACERCHGPGELHVRAGGGSAGLDLTIVNPARLSPALRESVCQQCHLQGWFRFPRAGRDSFDFRPGLPLHRFLAVFVREQPNPDRMELIGQVEQMESSRCFQASAGKLGCISCHDPHRLPPPETKAGYYRDRCLECHESRGCALPVQERRARGAGGDCIACHMPRPAVADIPHTLTTDHRILRKSGNRQPAPARAPGTPGLPGEFTPMDYHRGLMTAEEQQEFARDRGIALELAAQAMVSAPPLARRAAEQAVPLLQAALGDRTDDLEAREALGYALGMLGRMAEARDVYEEVLRVEPNRELTLPYFARTQGALGRPDLAASALREVIAVNPWRSDYRLALARSCAQAKDWTGAVAACREAIRLNPELFEARALLVESYLGSGAPEKADAEFQVLLKVQPASAEVWRDRYQRLKRARPSAAAPASNGHR